MYAYEYRSRASVEATVQIRATTTDFILRIEGAKPRIDDLNGLRL